MKRLAAVCVFSFILYGQAAKTANQRYHTAAGREAVAKGLNDAGRDERQKPRQLVEAMQLRPGMTVADIGTGVGFMLPYLSEAVGTSGRVLAEDIYDDFLEQAKKRAADNKLANVTFVKGTEHGPQLPAGSVDVALALDSYHHYDYPADMLAGIRAGLKPGGRLVIVEYYRTKDAMPDGNALEHIRLNKPELIHEVESNHFKLLSSHDHVPNSQYMAIFEKTGAR